MFALAIYLGSYAYAVFTMGMLSKLSFINVLVITLLWLFFGLWLVYERKALIARLLTRFAQDLLAMLENEPWWRLIVILLATSFLALLIGALGPELQHDALWYHLTLPKLYLQEGKIAFFPGDRLYYSGMPQLIEMFYIPSLMFGNEIAAKLIHFGFGLLTLIVVVILIWPRWGIKTALIACLLMLADLSFGWASATANIDLGRSFFELVGVYLLVRWRERPALKLLFKAGIVMGLALSTKYLSLASIAAMALIIGVYAPVREKIKSLAVFFVGVGVASLVWFVRAFYYTGNPLYPLFTKYIDNSYAPTPQNLWQWMQTPLFLSVDSSLWDQAISPLFVLLLPISFLRMRTSKLFKFLLLYALVTFAFWLLLPRTGGTRFLLPYLPIWAMLAGAIWSIKPKSLPLARLSKAAFALVIGIASFNILVRYKLNDKIIPVLVSKQSKQAFLEENLHVKTNILDVDGWLERNISRADVVHVVGKANLFYAPFKLQHESYGNLDEATHVLVWEAQPPHYVDEANLLYASEDGTIRLYRNK
jgi:4-amino-4-deoxy-L-arabinose transferase-like glycosyltransferase